MKPKNQNSKIRQNDLDFFRGVLIFGMAFVHFFAPRFEEIDFSLLSSSVAAGFMFFSGFVIGKILLPKKLPIFFLKNSGKIFGLFLIANLPFWILNPMPLRQFFFLLIDPVGRASFEILLPIAVLFALSPFLWKRIFVSAFVAFFGLFLFDFFSFFPYFFKMFFLGILGIFFGKNEEKYFLWNRAFFAIIFFTIFFLFQKIHLWTLESLFVFSFFTAFFRDFSGLSFFRIVGKNSLFSYFVHFPLLFVFTTIFSENYFLGFVGLGIGIVFCATIWERRLKKK